MREDRPGEVADSVLKGNQFVVTAGVDDHRLTLPLPTDLDRDARMRDNLLQEAGETISGFGAGKDGHRTTLAVVRLVVREVVRLERNVDSPAPLHHPRADYDPVGLILIALHDILGPDTFREVIERLSELFVPSAQSMPAAPRNTAGPASRPPSELARIRKAAGVSQSPELRIGPAT